MLYNLHFFPSKCRLFHNATLFGFCITHILNTGCATIWKKKSVAKRLKGFQDWPESLKEQKPFPVIAIKAYRGNKGTAPLSLNLSTSCRWVNNFTPWPLYPRKRTPEPVCMCWKREKSLTPTGIWTQYSNLQPVAYTLYRLRYTTLWLLSLLLSSSSSAAAIVVVMTAALPKRQCQQHMIQGNLLQRATSEHSHRGTVCTSPCHWIT